jgi:alpha-beta hydrolase superfamily lysophospholipase
MVGDNDQVIPPAATEALVARLGTRAEVKRYEGGYHMLLRDLAAAPRWSDVVTWIADRIGAAAAAPTG